MIQSLLGFLFAITIIQYFKYYMLLKTFQVAENNMWKYKRLQIHPNFTIFMAYEKI